MNHIYKVIWNKAKHCYTVVSEIAKSHSQSNKRVRSMTAVVAVAMMLTGFGGMAIEAANPANEDVNIEVGKGATTNTTMGNPGGLGGSVSGYIAIGEKACAWNGGNPDGIGTKEYLLDFKQGAVGVAKSFFGIPYKFKVTDGTKLAGAIAIGKNTMARTGSLMIGDHTYIGELGDIEVDSSDNAKKMNLNNGVYSTTLGASSYNGGSMSAVTGAFSIISNKGTSTSYGTQNFGATIYGSLNSIESSSVSSDSVGVYSAGMANSVLGFGNRTQNTNASLVWGTGNEVTNSIEDVTFSTDWNKTSASDAQKEIIKAMQSDQFAGGSVMAIGGGNKADWATYSQLLGVKNTLIGENGAVSKYDMINGYKNEVTNATHTSIIGSNNKANDVQATTVMGDNNDLTGNGNHVIGDNHKVTGKNNILIGNNKEQKTHSGSDSVIIGNNASAGNGSMVMGNEAHAGNTGIALGMNASAGNGQNLAIGYYANVSGAKNSTALGYASKVEKRDILSSDGNDGVVSVGKSVGQSGEAGITRRIINVKAGVNDTDAVNVSQLKGVKAEALKHSTVTNGDANITVTEDLNKDGGKEYKVALNNDITLAGDDPDAFVSISGSKGTIWTSGSVTAGSVAVGTAKADGTTPFFVDSNGAFYAADGKFSVDKDGNANANSIQTNALNAKYNLSVGTATDNGTMPFFVNSNGAFYAAGGEFVVDKDGSVKATSGDIGNVKLNNGVFYKNSALRDGELYVGDADGNYSQITSKNAKLGKVMIDDTGRISGVAAGRIAADSTDAVNGSQLHAVQQEAGKHTKVVNGSNITVEETDQDGQETYKVGLNKDLLLGDITGKNVSISGTNGTIETTGFIATKDKIYADKGAKLADVNVTGDTISNDKSSVKLDKEGTVTINNRVTIDQSGKISGVAVNVNSVQTNALNSKYNLSVGTAAADGKMPFFVNSNGAFYAAGGEFVVDKDGSVKATSGDIGNVKLNNGVFYKNSALRDGELYVGDADGNYSQITSKNAKLGKVMIDDTGRISGVAAGRIAADSTDAVNGSQLHAVQQEAGKHTKVVNGSNITVEETDQDGQETYKVGLNKDLLLGDITGKNVSISGTNGTIETTGFIATKDKIYADKGAKLADVNVTGDTISNDKSSVKLDKEGTVTINNRVTINQSGKISGVAAGEISSTSTDAVNGSQLKATNDRVSQVEGNITEIKGDITNIKSDITNIKGDVKNLGDRVTKVEQEAGKHTKVVNGSNVTVEETDQDGQKTYKVGLNKDLLLGDITGKNVSISGTNGTIETTGSIATKDKIYADKGAKLADIDITGDTISNDKSSVKLDKNGTVTINNKVTVDQDGKVSGVAAGVISDTSTDAVNGSQLFATNQQVSKLGNRINKVGAGAAALAALHPLDFDPDDKWDIAAGYGNYNGENAAAIGAYYRPNEDTMFSVGGSFGNGENMVNAGVSLKLGQGNHVSTSKVAMAKEIKDLRKELEGLKSALLDVNAGKKLDTSKLQLFPDVPKNHWAYEYVSTLKGNGALTGYPDGEFKGDRPMTRYEFATMLYKAMLEGATLSDRILKEFAPELEHFTVDTVHQDKDGKPTVERVRTVKAEK